MRRLLLTSLLVATTLFGVEFDFKTDITKPSLKKSFTAYWSARADKKFYKTYGYELPYLDYLHSQEWYEDFFAQAMRIKKIVVKKVTCKGEKCNVEFVFYSKNNPKNSHYFVDSWLKLEDGWYHSYNDNPLPGVTSF